jgi:hypothetical protein
MKMTASDYIFQLCQSGFGKFPSILKTPLVEAVRFSNSMAKFDRFHSGKALTIDLDGAEAEKKYLAKQWSKRRN